MLAVDVIRVQGYNATTVDDRYQAAGVTKGAFFHHFDSEQALAVAAAEHWSSTTGELFARADGVTAASLAVHIQAVLQGAFVVSKAANDPSIATDCIDHLHRYLTTLLEPRAVR